MGSDLEALEAVLARALLAADPWAEVRRALADPALPDGARAALAHVGEDGLRLSGLLVAKLRFELLMNGSRAASEWFEADPAAFTEAFRRYHRAVPPHESFPGLEGRRFDAWRARETASGPAGGMVPAQGLEPWT